jgi:hypothetical protein
MWASNESEPLLQETEEDETDDDAMASTRMQVPYKLDDVQSKARRIRRQRGVLNSFPYVDGKLILKPQLPEKGSCQKGHAWNPVEVTDTTWLYDIDQAYRCESKYVLKTFVLKHFSH